MKKETAIEVYKLALEAISSLTLILKVMPEDSSDEELLVIKRGIGTAIGDIQMDLLEVVIRQYPELDDLNEPSL